MSTEAIRAEFERWFSEDGAWPAAIEKDRSGEYKLAAAVSSWHTWEAAMQHSARAALAQPSDDGMCPNCVTPWKCNGPHIAPDSAAALAQRADEPVAWMKQVSGGAYFRRPQDMADTPEDSDGLTRFGWAPLYTAPQAPLTLSDEQIDRVIDAQWGSARYGPYEAHRAFARAIFAAAQWKP